MQCNYSRRIEGKEAELKGMRFLIYPFGAFTAANLSGELAGLLLPAVGALAPLLSDQKLSLDDDVSMISGDKIELLLKKLLCSKNIVLKDSGEYLTEETADEIFCAEIQDMFLLAFYVLRENFGGFFGKLGPLFGKLVWEPTSPMTPNDTDILTQRNSEN